MQGVADIADNALLVRFKFTRSRNPAAIQREAMKRMFRAFPAGHRIRQGRRGRYRAGRPRRAGRTPIEAAPAAAETKETPALAAAG